MGKPYPLKFHHNSIIQNITTQLLLEYGMLDQVFFQDPEGLEDCINFGEKFCLVVGDCASMGPVTAIFTSIPPTAKGVHIEPAVHKIIVKNEPITPGVEPQ